MSRSDGWGKWARDNVLAAVKNLGLAAASTASAYDPRLSVDQQLAHLIQKWVKPAGGEGIRVENLQGGLRITASELVLNDPICQLLLRKTGLDLLRPSEENEVLAHVGRLELMLYLAKEEQSTVKLDGIRLAISGERYSQREADPRTPRPKQEPAPAEGEPEPAPAEGAQGLIGTIKASVVDYLREAAAHLSIELTGVSVAWLGCSDHDSEVPFRGSAVVRLDKLRLDHHSDSASPKLELHSLSLRCQVYGLSVIVGKQPTDGSFWHRATELRPALVISRDNEREEGCSAPGRDPECCCPLCGPTVELSLVLEQLKKIDADADIQVIDGQDGQPRPASAGGWALAANLDAAGLGPTRVDKYGPAV